MAHRGEPTGQHDHDGSHGFFFFIAIRDIWFDISGINGAKLYPKTGLLLNHMPRNTWGTQLGKNQSSMRYHIL